MDVRTLCLGVLSESDHTGYDIKKFFESSFSSFFPAGYGSIYPALAQLLDKQLVSCVSLPQNKLPDKKVYQITESGLAQFRSSLSKGKGSHRLRSEFLVQMFFSDHLDERALAEVLDTRLSNIADEMTTMDEMIGNQQGANKTGGAAFTRGFNRAMLEAGRDYIKSHRTLIESQPDNKVTHIDSNVIRFVG